MIKDILAFLKIKIPYLYIEQPKEVNVEQFGVMELDLFNVDENCKKWIATIFLFTKKGMVKKHHKKITEIIDYCRFKGTITSDKGVMHIYPPQVNIAGKTDGYYVHTIAIPINQYEREEI